MNDMTEYIRELEDERGDLIDVFYFCSPGCWRDSFAIGRIGHRAEVGGASPCASSEPGSERDVHCAECGVLMASPDKEPPVVVNLIDRPPILESTGAAEPRTGV